MTKAETAVWRQPTSQFHCGKQYMSAAEYEAYTSNSAADDLWELSDDNKRCTLLTPNLVVQLLRNSPDEPWRLLCRPFINGRLLTTSALTEAKAEARRLLADAMAQDVQQLFGDQLLAYQRTMLQVRAPYE